MTKGILIALLLYVQISYASRIALSILLVLCTILVTELRKLLDAYGQQQRPTDTRSVYYDAVLWLLFFLALITLLKAQIPRNGLSSRLLRLLNSWRWEEVHAILMRYFYLDRICRPAFREIWDQALRIAARWPTLNSLESLRTPSTLMYLVMPTRDIYTASHGGARNPLKNESQRSSKPNLRMSFKHS